MRPIGMAPGPIPEDKIVWYAEQLEMDLVEQDAFVSVMRAVDVSWLNQQAEQSAKHAKSAKRGK